MQRVHDVIKILTSLIAKFGGANGVRDLGGLEAAIGRPDQTFDGQELYPSPQAKACAILESLVINHPFIDGNKRISYTMYRLTLLNAGWDIAASQTEKYEMVIGASTGTMRFEELLDWTERRLVEVKR